MDCTPGPAGRRRAISAVLPLAIAVLLAIAPNPAESAIVTVSSATDSIGAGNGVSLREALLSTETDADFNADVTAARTGVYGEDDEIRFAIGSGAQSLAMTSALPPIRHTVLIDGTTQPGYVDVPLITLDGSAAGAQSTGLSIAALSSASVLALVVRDFGGDGIAIHEALLGDGFESGGLAAPNGSDPPLVTLTDVGSLSNGGIGLRVVGGLAATRVEIAGNGSDGVLVDSGREVLLQSFKVHDNAGAGIRALAAIGDPYGLRIKGAGTEIVDNAGDGVVLGDPAMQSRPVRALVSDGQIHGNEVGVRVRQHDAVVAYTASTIGANNIYANRGAGLHISTSYQVGIGEVDRRTISANDVHHNAITGPADTCTIVNNDQTSAQVVFDGPISGTDPSVSNLDPDPGPNLAEYPGDYRCYWGITAGTIDLRNDTQAECLSMNNPNSVESDGVNNHCIWNGTQCRLAWDMAGREGVEACDSTGNRIFAYINDQNADLATQRGITALNGAYVRARRNTWGAGGASNGIFEDSGSDSRIDPNDDCGSISTCP